MRDHRAGHAGRRRGRRRRARGAGPRRPRLRVRWVSFGLHSLSCGSLGSGMHSRPPCLGSRPPRQGTSLCGGSPGDAILGCVGRLAEAVVLRPASGAPLGVGAWLAGGLFMELPRFAPQGAQNLFRDDAEGVGVPVPVGPRRADLRGFAFGSALGAWGDVGAAFGVVFAFVVQVTVWGPALFHARFGDEVGAHLRLAGPVGALSFAAFRGDPGVRSLVTGNGMAGVALLGPVSAGFMGVEPGVADGKFGGDRSDGRLGIATGMAGVALFDPASSDGVGVGALMADGSLFRIDGGCVGVGGRLVDAVHMVTSKCPKFGDETRPVILAMPVRIAYSGEQTGTLLLPNPDCALNP